MNKFIYASIHERLDSNVFEILNTCEDRQHIQFTTHHDILDIIHFFLQQCRKLGLGDQIQECYIHMLYLTCVFLAFNTSDTYNDAVLSLVKLEMQQCIN